MKNAGRDVSKIILVIQTARGNVSASLKGAVDGAQRQPFIQDDYGQTRACDHPEVNVFAVVVKSGAEGAHQEHDSDHREQDENTEPFALEAG